MLAQCFFYFFSQNIELEKRFFGGVDVVLQKLFALGCIEVEKAEKHNKIHHQFEFEQPAGELAAGGYVNKHNIKVIAVGISGFPHPA